MQAIDAKGLHFRHRYGHMIGFAILALTGLSIFRISLLAANFHRIGPELVPEMLFLGLRFDLITVAYFLIVPLFVFAFAPARASHALSVFSRIYYRMVFIALMAMEAIGVGFLAEYDHRPDALFWEYLAYPREVSQMLVRGFMPELLGTLVTVVLAYFISNRLLRQKDILLQPIARPAAAMAHVLVFMFAAVLLALTIRSSLGHRPANISTASFSDNRLANELALNSAYTAGYARYSRRHDSDNRELYGTMDFERAIDVVFDTTVPAQAVRSNTELPTVHSIDPGVPLARPRNVVIILEEGLGARYVGTLGGADLTPNFDRISRYGVLFTNLYATGTRTTRGIEAVLSGFPPSASQSVVKRSKSRRNFFTLAQLLGQHGYKSYFLYGGEANFDDMGSFMLGNGFDTVIAGADEFPEASFTGSWGVSDEDLARRAHEEFEKASTAGPFFGLMLSTSNHSPWEFPPGRIDPAPGPVATRENAIRYADYALGEFFALAQMSEYYDNTIFLVVADHDARVYGADFVPIDYFHIPGLLISSGIAPARYDRIASQIDLLPTILPLLGIAVETPTLGQDLFASDLSGPGRALMQYGMHNALMRGDDVVVRMPFMPVRQFRRRAGDLEPIPVNENLATLSLAYLTLASELYERKVYRLPDADPQQFYASDRTHVVSR